MKKLVLLFGMALGIYFTNPAVAMQSRTENVVVVDDEKEKIDPDDLPKAVKKTLREHSDYQQWMVDQAWVVKLKGKMKYYEIHLKKGEEQKIINLDKDGKTVEPQL